MPNDITIRLVVDDSQRVRFQRFTAEAERALSSVDGKFTQTVSKYQAALNDFGTVAANTARVGMGMLTAQVAGLAYAFAGLGKEFIRVNEQFGDLEITLGSALKSMSAASKVTKELVTITAQSPIPLESLARAVQSFSVIPQTRSLIREQAINNTLGDKNGFMRKSLQTVEQMSVFRPDQGPEGAIFAIREALGGQMRSLIRRFDIPSRFLAQTSGRSTKELMDDPQALMKALNTMFSDIISPEALTKFSRQPKNLFANIKEQLSTIPMFQVGRADPTTGADPYGKFLMRTQEVFDRLTDYMKEEGPFETKMAGRWRATLERLGASLADSGMLLFDKLFDSIGIITSGDRMDRLFEGVTTWFEKIAADVSRLAKSFAESDILPDFIDMMKDLLGVLGTVGSALKFVSDTFGTLPAIFTAMALPKLASNFGGILEKVSSFMGRTINTMRGVPAEALFGQYSGTSGGSGTLSPFSKSAAPSGRLSHSEASLLRAQVAHLAANSRTQLQAPTWFGLDMSRTSFSQDELDAAYEKWLPNAQSDMHLRKSTPPRFRSHSKGGGLTQKGYRAVFDRDVASYQGDGDFYNTMLAGKAAGMSDAQLIGGYYKKVGDVKAPSRFAQFGNAAAGMLGGAVMGMGVTAALAGVAAGSKMLYDALTEQSRKTEENTAALVAITNAKWENWTQSDLYQNAMRLVGNKMDTDAPRRMTEETKELQGFLEAFRIKKDGKSDTIATSAGAGWWEPVALDKIQEMGNTRTADLLEKMKAHGLQGIEPVIEELRRSQKAYEEAAKLPTKNLAPGVVDTTEASRADFVRTAAQKSAMEAVGKAIGGMGFFNQLMGRITSSTDDKVRKSQEDTAAKLAETYKDIDKDFLIKLVGGNVNTSSWNDVLGNRIAAKHGNLSMSDVESRAEGLGDPFALSSYTEMLGGVDAMTDKFAPYMKKLQDFNRFQKATAKAIEESGQILTDFKEQANSIVQDFTKWLPDLERMAADEKDSAQGARYRELVALIKDNKGDLLTKGHLAFLENAINDKVTRLRTATKETAQGLSVGAMADYATNFDKLNEEQVGDLNRFMKEAMDKAGVDMAAPFTAVMKQGEGTSEQIAASYEAALMVIKTNSDALSASIVAEMKALEETLGKAKALGTKENAGEIDSMESRMEALQALGRTIANTSNESNGMYNSSRRTALENELAALRDRRETEFQQFQYDNPEATRLQLVQHQQVTAEMLLQSAAKSDLADKQKIVNKLTEDNKRLLQEIADLQLHPEKNTRLNPRAYLTMKLEGIDKNAETQLQDEQFRNPYMTRKELLERQKTTVELKIQQAELSPIAEKQRIITALTAEQRMYQQELSAIQRDQTASAFWEGLTGTLETAKEDLYNFRNVGEQVGASIKHNLGNAFGDFVVGAASAKDAMRGFAITVLEEASRIMAAKAVAGLLNMFVGLFTTTATTAASGTFAQAGSGMSNLSWTPGDYSSFGVGKAVGGPVFGGSGVRDDLPHMLMGGEYVIRKSAVQKYGVGLFDGYNSGAIQQHAEGGLIGQNYSGAGGAIQGGDTHITINVGQGTERSGEDDNNAEKLAMDLESAVLAILARHSAPGGQVYRTIQNVKAA